MGLLSAMAFAVAAPAREVVAPAALQDSLPNYDVAVEIRNTTGEPEAGEPVTGWPPDGRLDDKLLRSLSMVATGEGLEDVMIPRLFQDALKQARESADLARVAADWGYMTGSTGIGRNRRPAMLRPAWVWIGTDRVSGRLVPLDEDGLDGSLMAKLRREDVRSRYGRRGEAGKSAGEPHLSGYRGSRHLNVRSLPRGREVDIVQGETLFDNGFLPDRLSCEVEVRVCEF
ncbi:MAG TPA: hypothetical protein PLM33_04640 [Acidobacteriota bacterium]|nr:hypothetical protein [Acidobacteriota bacterium]HRR57154.1 hypothetical protein [Acidobacteriota bacterium]HRV08278.1 hypothetical protein [Acidobacteriota bacterium]